MANKHKYNPWGNGPEEKTGRFSTREELEREVLFMYHNSDLTRKQLAENVEVSVGTVQNIIKVYLSKPADPKFAQLKRRMLLQRW